eukprot:jgi/Mesvir1/23960/Mv10728-RA.1
MGIVASYIASRLAFFPPNPPTYSFVQDPVKGTWTFADIGEHAGLECRMITTRRKTQLATMFLRRKTARYTLLYSHGNAVDLGLMRQHYSELSITLNVNVFGYDYSGYGASQGTPSEAATYADIDAAYACLLEEYHLAPESIVLYGQSVGSGPSCDLAARVPPLGGIILHSPLLSGIRVMHPVSRTWSFDIYKNIDKITKVTCPVLVLHGTADEVIDVSHGQRLVQACQNPYRPLWVPQGGHCDLEMSPHYLPHLRDFFLHLAKVQDGVLPHNAPVAGAMDAPPRPPVPAGEEESEHSGSRAGSVARSASQRKRLSGSWHGVTK